MRRKPCRTDGGATVAGSTSNDPATFPFGQRRYFHPGVTVADVLLCEADRFIRSSGTPLPDPVLSGIFELVRFAKGPADFLVSPALAKFFGHHPEACLKFLSRLLLDSESALNELCNSTIPSQEFECFVKSFRENPKFLDYSSNESQGARAIYDELRRLLENPREWLALPKLAEAFETDRQFCLSLSLHLVRFIQSLPVPKKLLLEESQIKLPSGRTQPIVSSTADEISGHMLKQHGVTVSSSLANKYIRRLHHSGPAIYDVYYRYRILSSFVSGKGAESHQSRSILLFDPHQVTQALEYLAGSTSEITIRLAQKSLKPFRHPSDLREERDGPTTIKISASG